MAAASIVFQLILLLIIRPANSAAAAEPTTIYVVHMDTTAFPAAVYSTHQQWYSSTIRTLTAVDPQLHQPDVQNEYDLRPAASKRIIYTYGTAFHGFAAHLTDDEAAQLPALPGVLAVLPDQLYQLHTTRSPDFLGIGLNNDNSASSWAAALADRDVIVGVLDTGIWPESPSFSDGGMGPVPARWKGACETGRGFGPGNCNRKIVGARVFYHGFESTNGRINETAEYKSPRDQDGHGTHTAATVAGVAVRDANLFGYARGTARGMAPRARVAVYKVCWTGGCFSSDILAAVDRAVADGVDVLSISLGGGAISYARDSLAIASFGAMEMGVFVACSAGNGGPTPVSLTNMSPWIMTVGASTMDRDFPATIRLGNGRNLTGVSLYKGQRNLSPEKQYSVVYLGSNTSSGADPRSLCLEGSLDPHTVAGKIVVCDRGVSPRVQKGQVVKNAGGVGMILANTAANGDELVADSHLLPAVAIGDAAGRVVRRYSKAEARPTATLSFQGTKLGIRPSPVVAAFSSRGPNLLTMEILKPDLVAPGVNILAAWSGANSPSNLPSDPRRVGFNILSGTSMSCPHVAGVAALVRASHPDWSPAAIKSALMTTAYVHDNTFRPLRDSATGEAATPYSLGAGHIHPVKALDPGLVYDMDAEDYFQFLCTQKLTPVQLKSFGKYGNRSCKVGASSAGDLNYPAFSAVILERPAREVVQRRTVTNVGPPSSTYSVKVRPLKGAEVVVEPRTLQFTRSKQRLSYRVTIRTRKAQSSPEFGDLTWSDGVHLVRSPIVVAWPLPL